jgi:outer membrane biosynthesis protein TonB
MGMAEPQFSVGQRIRVLGAGRLAKGVVVADPPPFGHLYYRADFNGSVRLARVANVKDDSPLSHVPKRMRRAAATTHQEDQPDMAPKKSSTKKAAKKAPAKKAGAKKATPSKKAPAKKAPAAKKAAAPKKTAPVKPAPEKKARKKPAPAAPPAAEVETTTPEPEVAPAATVEPVAPAPEATAAEPNERKTKRDGLCRVCRNEAELCNNCQGSGVKKRDGKECGACKGTGRKAFCADPERKCKESVSKKSAPATAE